jgi:8-oxo-dGTP diphosphatase
MTMTHQTDNPDDPKIPRFHVAVDVVALTIKRNLLQVAVVRRDNPMSCIIDKRTGIASEVSRKPTDYALPGGRVKWQNENLVDAARRELAEETGIELSRDDLVQIGAYGDVGRDPRSGRTISVAFVAFNAEFATPFAGSDAASAEFMDVIEVLAEPNRLEFDHSRIIREAISRVRDLMERTPIALKFCDEEFTLSDLRHVYEVIFHAAYNEDANALRYADRIRSEEALTGGREREEQIRLISRTIQSSEQIGFSSRGAPDSFRALGSQGLSSGRRSSSNDDVVDKVQRLLKAEYRRNAAMESRNPDSARANLKINLDPANFSRKATAIEGFIEEVPESTRSSASGTGKPAQLYRKGKAEKLDPPLVVQRRPTKPAKRPTK